MFEGEEGKKRPRERRKVRDQVAEQVAGFANAEGGVLILGIEDDHRVTGHQLPPDALAALLDVPRVRLHPPQPQGSSCSSTTGFAHRLRCAELRCAGGAKAMASPCASGTRPCVSPRRAPC